VSGIVYVEKMVRGFCEKKGLLIVGSYGGDYVVEDKGCKRYQAKCKGRDQLRWIELIPTKRKNLGTADLAVAVFNASVSFDKLNIHDRVELPDSRNFATDLLQYCE